MRSSVNSQVGTRSDQDDILIFDKDKEEHDGRLLQLLRILKAHNILINAKKSQFQLQKLNYLGYTVDGEGIRPDFNRVAAFRDAPRPSSVKALQSFLGFTQYYAKFVRNFSLVARPLFDLVAAGDPFEWTDEAEKAYNALMDAILQGPTLRSFQTNRRSEVIVDASETTIGAVLEQDSHPVVCISRRLSKAEVNYSQTQREALAVVWAVRRLHKYLFGSNFLLVTDHKALKYIFQPESSLAKATTAMLQRWAIELSAYSYEIQHRSGKNIPHADFLSRYAFAEEPTVDENQDDDFLLVNPLPISRNLLIQETKLVYGQVIAGLRRGWSLSARKKFPELHSMRNDLTLQADGVILVRDRPLIPPTCRKPLLQHLHVGHLGRDKMRSLARLICWWPSLNADIDSFLKECSSCQRQVKTTKDWKPWPIPYTPMQRIHADYCGPFLTKYYALVIEDAHSRYPEVFLSSKATADFTRTAFRKFFSREGVPQVVVTDNGTHFSSADLTSWLKSIGCQPVFTAPRHPCSNGLAERFVRTLKTTISTNSPTTVDELSQVIDSFLLQYRNAVHPTTGKSPAFLFKGRNLRTSANLDTTDVTFFRGNNTRPCDGLILGKIGSRMYNVMDRDDGTVHRRHIDQMNISAPSPPPQHTGFEDDSRTPLMENLPTPLRDKQQAMDSSTLPGSLQADRSDAEVPTPSLPSPSTSANDATAGPTQDSATSPFLRRSKRERRPPARFRNL